jgi:hypothetical protein
MRIKEPTLISTTATFVYEVDVDGKKIKATCKEGRWEYDLSPCYVDLNEEEIDDLEQEFVCALGEIKTIPIERE